METKLEVGKEYYSTSRHELVTVLEEPQGEFVHVENEDGERFMVRATKLEMVDDG
jgi:hypothetical protein